MHLDDGLIHAWLDGALPPGEASRVEQHVATCAECAARVAEARGLIAGATRIVSSLDIVRGGVLPSQRIAAPSRSLWNRLHFTPARAALAASLLVAVSSLMVARHEPRAPVPSTAMSSPASPASSAAPVQSAPAAAPVSPSPVRTPTVPDSNRAVPSTALAVPNAAVARSMKTTERADMDARRLNVHPFNVDSLKARDANPAGAVPMPHKLRLAPRPLPLQELQEVVTTSAQSAARGAGAVLDPLARCYQLAPDTAFGLGALPSRFLLASATRTSDTTRLVHAVTSDGRIDTVLAGAYWRRLSPTSASVFFAASLPNQPIVLTLTVDATTAQVSQGSQSHSVSIKPIDCRE